jgi:hypothetical protein
MAFLRRTRAAADAEAFAFKMILFVVFVDNMAYNSPRQLLCRSPKR